MGKCDGQGGGGKVTTPPPTQRHHSVTRTPARGHAGRPGPGALLGPGRGPVHPDEVPELRAAAEGGSVGRHLAGPHVRPSPAGVRNRHSRLSGARAGKVPATSRGRRRTRGLGLGSPASAAPLSGGPAGRAPQLPGPAPTRGPPRARFVSGGGEGRPPSPGPRPGHKRARGRREAAGGGLRDAHRAGPGPGAGGRGRGRAAARSPAVEPVLAGVALDHEAGNIVGEPADAVHGHRRHVRRAARPPLGPRCAPGSGRAGRAGRGPGPGTGTGTGPGTGPGAHYSPRAPGRRVHTKRGARCRAAPGAARWPAGRRARVCAGDGPRAGHKREWTRGGGGRRAAAPPKGPPAAERPLRQRPGWRRLRPPAWAAAPAAGRRAGDRGEGGPGYPAGGEGGPGEHC